MSGEKLKSTFARDVVTLGTEMRSLIAIIVSVFLSLNAAYAAVLGVCDALENRTERGVVAEHLAHFAHHSHHDQATDGTSGTLSDTAGKAGAADQKSPTKTPSNHCHAHPSFSSLLPGSVFIPALPGREALSLLFADVFVSARPSRLERPPRALLA